MSAARPKHDPALGASILGARVDRDAPKPGTTASRSTATRLTVDLDPPLRAKLGKWAFDAAGDLDVPRVVLADVVRQLIHRLVDDPKLSAQILDQLRDLQDS